MVMNVILRSAELFWRYDQTSSGIGQDFWIAYAYLDSKENLNNFQMKLSQVLHQTIS